tara:strand:- start:104 stop:331 length:228 start_codon:yes stop_codon:yes gene_type:complete
MRQFKPTYEYKIKFSKKLHETKKAILFLIKNENVSIWIPKSWIERIGKTYFAVRSGLASEVRLKIYAEQEALKNK